MGITRPESGWEFCPAQTAGQPDGPVRADPSGWLNFYNIFNLLILFIYICI